MSVFEPLPDFVSGDPFLHALLGVIALCRETDGSGPAASGGPSSRVAAPDDPVVDALLGSMRLRDHLLATIGSLAPALPCPSAAAASERAGVEDILR
jgi:hypothetical protein